MVFQYLVSPYVFNRFSVVWFIRPGLGLSEMVKYLRLSVRPESTSWKERHPICQRNEGWPFPNLSDVFFISLRLFNRLSSHVSSRYPFREALRLFPWIEYRDLVFASNLYWIELSIWTGTGGTPTSLAWIELSTLYCKERHPICQRGKTLELSTAIKLS